MSPMRARKENMILKLIITVVLSAITFSLGTFVGKKISDAQKIKQERQAKIFEEQHKESSIKQEIEAITKMLEEVNRANGR